LILPAIEEALRDWTGGKRRRGDGEHDEESASKIAKMFEMEGVEQDEAEEEGEGGSSSHKVDADAHDQRQQQKDKKDHLFKSHVPVPSQEDIQKFLLERKKQILMAKYVSEDLSAADKETKELTGRH